MLKSSFVIMRTSMTFHLNEYGRRVERSQKVSLINAVFDVAERNKWLGMTWKPPSYCSSQNASSRRRLLVMLHTTFYELALRKNLLLLFFPAKLDGVKTYMRLRRVPNSLQNKVIKWFDYLWLTQKSSDEEKAVSCLPGDCSPLLFIAN